jgi:16S rRNA (cytosine1402-N4)-methyltransferase
MMFHRPVMLKEVVESLHCKKNGIYVDGTVGGGGHACAILEKTAPDGLLIGIDLDEEALAEAEERLRIFGGRKILIKGDFTDMADILSGLKISLVDGILLDLGVSSHQLDSAGRGFSFSQEAPLDMRMDLGQSFTAGNLVNNFTERELEKIIRDYGEEKMARKIAKAIVKRRETAPIMTTTELADVISRAASYQYGRQGVHPATRTFQAVRIAVNNELAKLPEAITNGLKVLADAGRFSIISFHSLEDRIVKSEFRVRELKVLTKKPLRPGNVELADNPRARSARLRTAERI